MNSRISCSTLLKPLSKHSCGRSVACAKGTWSPRRGFLEKVCHKLTWRMTYLRKPGLRCMSRNCWLASKPPLARQWTARAWSPHSPRKWPAAIVSCGPTKILLAYARRSDDPFGGTAGDPVGMAGGVSPAAQLEESGPAGSGLSGLPGPPDTVADYLDQWGAAAQLEQRVLSAFALSVGRGATVCADLAAGAGGVSGPAGGSGGRRHSTAQDGPADSSSFLSTRPAVAALSRQPDAGLALSAGLVAGAAVPAGSGQHARRADRL